MRRVIGLVIVLAGVSGVALSIGGTIIGRQIVDEVGEGLDTSLRLASESLDTVNDTLLLTKTTVSQAGDSLATVSETAVNVSVAISDTRPLLTQVTDLTTQNVPDSLDAVQASLPNVAEVAEAIDSALRSLSRFQINRRILGIPLRFDLGIQYDPTQPFDETVLEISSSLNGVPDDLRGLEVNLDATNQNLDLITDNVLAIAEDLDQINTTVNEMRPMLDDYIRLVTETSDLIRQTRANLSLQLKRAQLGVTVLFIWIGLSQIAPLYLGLALVAGRSSLEPEAAEETKRDEKLADESGNQIGITDEARLPSDDDSTRQLESESKAGASIEEISAQLDETDGDGG